MSHATSAEQFDPETIAYLHELSRIYPTSASVLNRLSMWEAEQTLPKGAIHVISDIHGEHVKLRHVINNASGYLRSLVDRVFGNTLSDAERLHLLNVIYYPLETATMQLKICPTAAARLEYVERTLAQQAELFRELASLYPIERTEATMPEELRGFLRELLFLRSLNRSSDFRRQLLAPFLAEGREIDLLRAVSRVLRNLSIDELVIAGDFGDRGPRIDRVIDTVMRQPRVAITWGNHDVSWMGACLGSWVCIATVLRMSLRYQRLSQLEEGYGIPLNPLEDLVAAAYADDPASQFVAKGAGTRDPLLVARMQKAIAIMQFKLEAQAAARNAHFEYTERTLLHQIDRAAGTVVRNGSSYPLLDTRFPTVDPADPYRLNPAEERCMRELAESFLFSPRLWEQMKYIADHGSMYLIRDGNLIFHACVPVDTHGDFLSFPVDGTPFKGKALFDALTQVVHRAFRERRPADLDLLWYLWSGPRSPLFGKDIMTTFETYFLADKATHAEHKNPYFQLIHERSFCERVLSEFGVDKNRGLIVNGHVPVKVEKGESPLKRSGKAVTIDGAFSQAYGDIGFTLVLEAARTYLAQHHAFDSVLSALEKGADIVPTIQVLNSFDPARPIEATERGEHLRHSADALRLLLRAYRENRILEQG